MAGLQRSAVSFRRQGSSGFVWDDKFLSEEFNKQDHNQQHDKDAPPPLQRTRSNGGYRAGKVSPAIEPPSPRFSACGFCGAFGKAGDKGQRAKHRPR